MDERQRKGESTAPGSGVVDPEAQPTAQPSHYPEEPAQQTPGEAFRAPGRQGVAPPGEDLDVATAASAVGMARAGSEPAGDNIGDLADAPLDELPAMPGTSEELAPVDGVRIPPARA